MTELFANVPKKKRKKQKKKKKQNIFILYRFNMAPNYLDLLTEKTITYSFILRIN